MAKRFHSGAQGSYEGYDERREQEVIDASMMPTGKGNFANMPQEVIMKQYPRVHQYLDADIDDTIRGVDRQITLDGSQRSKHSSPKKV